MTMHRILPCSFNFLRIAALAVIAVAAPAAHAFTLWTGANTNYTQPSPHDGSLPADQDRLTANVWLTRGSKHPMYNAKTETTYSSSVSPKDTEWAFGILTNHANLHFTNWGHWVGGAMQGKSPITMVGSNVVVHLKTDDIYLQIKFSVWVANAGGGYTYTRSTPAPPPPTPTVTLTNPVGGAVFSAPANVHLGASASVSSGTVTNVSFFKSGNPTPLGTATLAPFNVTANNLAAGPYVLTAVATAAGISATSTPVSINIINAADVSTSPPTLANGMFMFNYNADVGLTYVVQNSPDLASWAPVTTNVASSSSIAFSNAFLPDVGAGYFRVDRQPNP